MRDNSLLLCEDMINAGFTNPNTDKPIKFCNNCSHPQCILFDTTSHNKKTKERAVTIFELSKTESSIAIANKFGISQRTVARNIKRIIKEKMNDNLS